MLDELILAACTEYGRLTFPHACSVWQWLRIGFFYYEVNQSIVYLFINKLSCVAIQCAS